MNIVMFYLLKRVKQSHVKESISASMNMQCEKSSRKIFCLARR